MSRASGWLAVVLVVAGCPSPPAAPITRASSAPAKVASAPPATVLPPEPETPPPTFKKPVTDIYQAVSVTDDYRWLEDGDDPEVKAWSAAQNSYARRVLDKATDRDTIRTRLKALMGFESPDWLDIRYRGGKVFAMKAAPPRQQPFIVVMKSADAPDTEKVVFDPNAIDKTGGTSMDWFMPSADGKLVAVSLSQGGSESGTLHIYDVDTGKEHASDAIPRVNGGTAGGSMAWLVDGTGFFYTRYPAPGERPATDLGFYQEVWFHKLGTDPKGDVPSLQRDLPRIAEITLQMSDDGHYLLASVANGDGGDFDQWMFDVSNMRQINNKWRRFASIQDKIVEAHFAPDSELWLRSEKDAPRGKLLKLPPGGDLSLSQVVVRQSDAVIDSFLVTQSRVYTADLVGGPYQVRVFDRAGGKRPPIPIPPITSVWQLTRLDGDDILVRTESFVRPGAWSLFHDREGKLADTPLAKKPAASFDDVEVVRETCTSKDGTKVPLNILRKKGTKLDGSNKLLLTGYGGFGLSESPWFDVRVRLWLDEGGVYADANLRGGSEFGETWHTSGSLTKKQNVFDDFIACAHHVIDAGYTKPEHLAIMGGSNGGLLMGAALTEAPGLFHAVVSRVGIYDMLRVENTPNGAFNVTEYGSVKDKAQLDAMLAYSPYQHVKDGTAYPAVLFMTGANDPRVDPYHSRKMVARLQAASPKSTILLRTSGTTGHGIGTPLDTKIDEQVDVWSFLLSQVR